jgi:hypothetical protein
MISYLWLGYLSNYIINNPIYEIADDERLKTFHIQYILGINGRIIISVEPHYSYTNNKYHTINTYFIKTNKECVEIINFDSYKRTSLNIRNANYFPAIELIFNHKRFYKNTISFANPFHCITILRYL